MKKWIKNNRLLIKMKKILFYILYKINLYFTDLKNLFYKNY